MDQVNVAAALLQTMASQTELPKPAGKTDGDGLSDFQKMLEEKSQEKDPLLEEPARTRPRAETGPVVKKTEKASVEKPESPLERAKKLAEQGAWFTQPQVGFVDVNLETGEIIAEYQPGEYILAHLDGQTEVIPTVGLEPWERFQLQQLLAESGQTIDVTDPAADALLEATDPNVEHGPAELLEEVVDEQAGKVIGQAVEGAQPQQQDEEETPQGELLDMEQAPRQLFRDVEAAPVKVGEVYDAQPAEETDVAQQLSAGVAQALERGESLVRVRLNPQSLGEVTVELRQSAEGILHVAITAQNSQTRGLLERHAGDLQGLLSARGQAVEVEVQQPQENQQNQNQHQNQQRNYEGQNGGGQSQDGQERRQRRTHTSSQDFLQQLRLGLIPTEEF